MKTRTEQKAATRHSILSAATRLFGRNGVLATSTAEVAAEAGISHGALFVHFPTREDLRREVIGEVGRRIARDVHDAAAEGMGIRDVLRIHLRAIAAEEEFYSRLLVEGPLLGMGARATLIGLQSAVAHHLFASYPATLGNRPLWFNTWIGLVHHYVLNRDLFSPGGSVLEEHGETLIAHFVGLIANQGVTE